MWNTFRVFFLWITFNFILWNHRCQSEKMRPETEKSQGECYKNKPGMVDQFNFPNIKIKVSSEACKWSRLILSSQDVWMCYYMIKLFSQLRVCKVATLNKFSLYVYILTKGPQLLTGDIHLKWTSHIWMFTHPVANFYGIRYIAFQRCFH